ncbi:MAG: phenylalanine--tRNA ligase subunit beta [Candidatus Aminicenantales bacterium]
MRVSLEWLKEYVEIDIPLSVLMEKLDMIGLVVEEQEKREGDVILDIETHANRPDTLGHLGVAREISAAFGFPFRDREWTINSVDSGGEKTADLIDIQINDPQLCRRYCGVVVRNVRVEPSPEWLKKRIEAMRLNPINNIVDITNYVLFATGHPIHAFDLARIKGRKIVVRQAQKGEMLITLDREELSLSPPQLVIADAEKPVALAGIIGGEGSAVSATTKDVLIESAWFDPVSVRKTSKQVGIQTEASYRFERGADVSYPPCAALMAASLLSQFGGQPAEEILDVNPVPPKKKIVILRHHQVGTLLGIEIDQKFISQTLTRLGFHLEEQKPGMWQVTIPTFRVDIEREIDLIEEIARFYGYDRIPSSLPQLRAPEPYSNDKRECVHKVRRLLNHQGFDEVVNYSFSDPEEGAPFLDKECAIVIRNPISRRASYLRTSLLDGLLATVRWNKNRGAEGVSIFEVGNIYFWEEGKACEQLMLGIATSGLWTEERNEQRSEENIFFHLKGALEAMMFYLRYEPFSFEEVKSAYFDEGYSLNLVFKGERIGCLGKVKSEILNLYSLKDSVYAAEINLTHLLSKQPKPFKYTTVPKFPSVSRDLSFLVDRGVSYQSIKQAIEELKISYLEKFSLLDRFQGEPIPGDKISLSLRFVFRHPQRTLLAREVDNLQLKIIKRLESGFKIQLREGGKIDKRTGKN